MHKFFTNINCLLSEKIEIVLRQEYQHYKNCYKYAKLIYNHSFQINAPIGSRVSNNCANQIIPFKLQSKKVTYFLKEGHSGNNYTCIR